MAKLIDKIKFNEIEFLMFVLDELADELSKDGKDVIKLTVCQSCAKRLLNGIRV